MKYAIMLCAPVTPSVLAGGRYSFGTRALVDCMIASVAHRHGAALLALDKDLRRVAEVGGVEMDSASPELA